MIWIETQRFDSFLISSPRDGDNNSERGLTCFEKCPFSVAQSLETDSQETFTKMLEQSQMLPMLREDEHRVNNW